MGTDVDGVSRNMCTAFWTKFLDSAVEDANVRVSSLSHNFQEEEWKSFGRILTKGLKDHGYISS